MWGFKDFPFLRATQKWFEAKRQCTAAHALRQQEPELMEISDKSEDAKRNLGGREQMAKGGLKQTGIDT
jgi:hypothetical protein